MTSWSARYRLAEGVRESLWAAPLAGGVVGAALGAAVVRLDHALALTGPWAYSPATAGVVLAALAAAEVVVTGILVFVFQSASSASYARPMRLWSADGTVKAMLALVLGTIGFSFVLLSGIEDNFVPNLGVTIAVALVVVVLVGFLAVVGRVSANLRPVAVASVVGVRGVRSFRESVARTVTRRHAALPPVAGQPTIVVRTDRAGAIRGYDMRGLVRWASAHDCLLVVRRPVGEFVGPGAEVIAVWGPAKRQDARRLRGHVALGVGRSLDRDTAFAIRSLVDIANQALSPTVNDPTTAVQVIDYLGEVLRVIGSTTLEGALERRDASGVVRLIVPTPRWEDYLSLAVMEIREYGATSVQVVRRLRAMLEELRGVVRPEHVPAVDEELARLDDTVHRSFADSVDLDRAAVADSWGVGGASDEAGLQSRTVHPLRTM
jgi:uncharacterized membrane protein